jgi:hypothetical protein
MSNMTKRINIITEEKLYVPQLIEVTSRREDWINYGEENLYPDYLISLLEKSAIHKSIQTGKQDMAMGDGLKIITDNLPPEQMAIASKFMNMPNPNESLDDISYKILMDLIVYGAYALNIIWSKDRQTIAEIYHIDYGKLRVGKPNADGKITHYYYSSDWSQYKKDDYAPEKISTFSMDERKEASQVYICKEYNPAARYYAIPQYSASIPYVEIDYEIGMYHLNNIQNQLSPNYLLQINTGVPEEEEQDELFRQVKKELTGHKGHKFMLTFGTGADSAPTFIPIQTTDSDKQFLVLNEAVLQALCTANKVTSPMLLGVKTPGQLGGRSELMDAYDLYYATVINKIQKHVLKTYDKILMINGSGAKLDFIKAEPLPFTVSEQALLQVADRNEVRDMVGLEPIEPQNNPEQPIV